VTTLALTLTQSPPSSDPDDVVLYEWGSREGPARLLSHGSDYEPASPLWIVALHPGNGWPLWARVFTLTDEARSRRRVEREQERRAAEEARLGAEAAAVQRELALLWGAVRKTHPDEWPGLDVVPFRDMQAMARVAEVSAYQQSRRVVGLALVGWATRMAEERGGDDG
jgi:hypothetical protein